jgi:hypothetical protein
MKRLIAIVAAGLISLAAVNDINAGNFGFFGGANFSTMNLKELNAGTMTQWHAGMAYRFDLPLGFKIQPALMYNVKGAKVGNDWVSNDLSIGYLEFMASCQWGPDLLLFRPFVEVSPFLGYGINGSWGDVTDLWKGDGINRVEYGLGLGAGIEVWRFQLTARYNWNFGRLSAAPQASEEGLFGGIGQIYNKFNDANFGGFTLTLAYFF